MPKSVTQFKKVKL